MSLLTGVQETRRNERVGARVAALNDSLFKVLNHLNEYSEYLKLVKDLKRV